ncbi:MAG: nucleotidyltransferase domain-containing protein, partial [Pseudomonadota bacterium]|nr:nucleotidyltransferase domain-containing protein [Pseudomonadota bacterium]
MFYKTHYTDHQLFNPHNFVDELTASASKLEVFRNTLKHGHEILKSRFQSHMNATEYVIQRAWLVDQILLQIYQHLCICSNIQSVALVAVGGYGRGELHPGSDVDLMILLASAPDIATQSCIEHFITFLWDIRLQVGHSVRTLDDCVYEATADISVATNLMEARLIQGPQSLFDAMQDRLSPDKLWPNKEFFEAKLQEQTLRHQKYHDTAYNLEPNIKEGPGGLRDIQMIGWVAKRHFGAKTLHDLIKRRFLTEYEYRTLIESQEFIWKIRCLLHLFANRREDRLLFDYQKMLASAFNYHDDKNRLGVEQFMKQYFRTVMVVRNLNDMLLQFFQEAILYAQAPVTIYALNKRFQVRNDFIEVAHDKVFMHYPFALLELFLLMQQNPGIKGVRASTIRLIRHSIHLIDEAFHKDLRARSLFFEILRQPQGLTHALRRMSNYGILG